VFLPRVISITSLALYKDLTENKTCSKHHSLWSGIRPISIAKEPVQFQQTKLVLVDFCPSFFFYLSTPLLPTPLRSSPVNRKCRTGNRGKLISSGRSAAGWVGRLLYYGRYGLTGRGNYPLIRFMGERVAPGHLAAAANRLVLKPTNLALRLNPAAGGKHCHLRGSSAWGRRVWFSNIVKTPGMGPVGFWRKRCMRNRREDVDLKWIKKKNSPGFGPMPGKKRPFAAFWRRRDTQTVTLELGGKIRPA